MRIHKFLLVFAAAVLAAQTSTVPGPRAGARGGARAGKAVQTALGLSDQQLQQLVQLRQDERPVLQPVREQMKSKREALQAARQAPNPNPTQIGQLTIDMQNLHKQVQAINEDYHNRALAVLDEAQKTKLKNLENGGLMRPAARGAVALNLLLPREARRAPRRANP